MNIVIVSDAWEPQVNGVVRTLKMTSRELSKKGHTVQFITPNLFKSFPCFSPPPFLFNIFQIHYKIAFNRGKDI